MVRPNINEIRHRREEKGYSQHQLSLKAGLSGCALSRIEGGKTSKVHPLRAKAIAEALDCQLEEVFVLQEKGGCE